MFGLISDVELLVLVDKNRAGPSELPLSDDGTTIDKILGGLRDLTPKTL